MKKQLYILMVVVLTAAVGCNAVSPPVVRTAYHCTSEEERTALSAFITQCVSGNLGEADRNMVYSCEDVGKRTVCPRHQHEYEDAVDTIHDDYVREVIPTS
jgi:hypothetical protein